MRKKDWGELHCYRAMHLSEMQDEQTTVVFMRAVDNRPYWYRGWRVFDNRTYVMLHLYRDATGLRSFLTFVFR